MILLECSLHGNWTSWLLTSFAERLVCNGYCKMLTLSLILKILKRKRFFFSFFFLLFDFLKLKKISILAIYENKTNLPRRSFMNHSCLLPNEVMYNLLRIIYRFSSNNLCSTFYLFF